VRAGGQSPRLQVFRMALLKRQLGRFLTGAIEVLYRGHTGHLKREIDFVLTCLSAASRFASTRNTSFWHKPVFCVPTPCKSAVCKPPARFWNATARAGQVVTSSWHSDWPPMNWKHTHFASPEFGHDILMVSVLFVLMAFVYFIAPGRRLYASSWRNRRIPTAKPLPR
jgi:hypothetical protein